MMKNLLASIRCDLDYVKQVEPRLWLMDDHRWAFLAWASSIPKNKLAHLAHLDYHYDAIDDISNQSDLQRVADAVSDCHRGARGPEELTSIIRQNDLIGCTSFIAPAVRLGMVGDVHFLCKQSAELAFDRDFRKAHSGSFRQFRHRALPELTRALAGRAVLFDLCLDLFNRSEHYGEGDLWPDRQVLALIDSCGSLITDSLLVTVSLSYGYSGTEEQTRHLASLVVPRIAAYLRDRPLPD
jgi:hypothetical protein